MAAESQERTSNRSIMIPLRTALIYAIVGAMWILFSDLALEALAFPPKWQTYKGWAFVVVTALVLYVVLRSQLRKLEQKTVRLQHSQERIRRLNRVHALLSNINQAIVRVREPQALFDQACRIAVEQGGFCMAWIGLVNEATNRVEVAASAGATDGYLQKLDIVLSDGPRGRGPTGTALRAGRHVVVNDIAGAPHMAPWREDALRLGFRASAAFPLEVAGEVRGTINLYAGLPGFFDDDELTLLDELALDISFALEFCEKEKQRKQAEESLRDTGERLQRTAIAGNVGLWDWDLRTNEIYFSPEWKRQLGYEDHEFGNGFQEWKERIHPDDIDRVLQHVDEQNSRRTPHFEQEYRCRHKDGSYRWILLRGAVLSDNQQRPVRILGTHVDITEHKRLEEQLLQVQKMESVGRLAGGVAHDFNNLLNVIIGYADLALQGLSEGDPLHVELREIRQAGDRAAALTRQLLAFSRKQVLQTEVLDLVRLMKDEEKMFQRLIGEDIELVLVASEDVGRVKADPGQLEQVFMNLVVNARDAMPDGGKLTIEIANADLDESYAAEHSTVIPGPYVRVTVSDSGMGMNETTMGKIFDPFFTTKEQGKGTGLGLATTYGIVKQSGGCIFVYSEIGKGTAFKIYLPRVEWEEQESRPVSAVLPAAPCDKTILIAEDESTLRVLTQRILEGAGYTVLAAANGADALNLFASRGKPVHLLLTDVIMPKMTGSELAQRLGEIHPGLKVLYMSGYTDEVITRHGVLEDAMHFISKPFTADDLVQKVRAILELPEPEDGSGRDD